jgi:hypothetical protein
MNVRGYSYSEASKYIIAQRFKISLTQDFQNFLKYLFVASDLRPDDPPPVSRSNNLTAAIENNITTPQPEYKLEDTFQVKLRKKKLDRPKSVKKNIDETKPEEIMLQKDMETLYSQVKKKLPQLNKTTEMIDTIVKNVIINL